ncbi:altronate dehydratase [Campylobacter fetus]|nr:altronate dehydratase [Campylobacter fetus]
MNAIHVDERDNAATALKPIQKGSVELGVTIIEDISKGHKFATKDIKKGEAIIKYSSVIGIANQDIKKGAWIHVHNIEGTRGRGDISQNLHITSQEVKNKKQIVSNDKKYELQGYRRSDGSFGLRNHILILPSVHCANKVVEKIAAAINYGLGLGNDECKVVYVTHQHGCSQLEFDARQTMDTLVGNGANPNIYGVLVIGLGCEVISAQNVAKEIKDRAPYKEVEHFTIQQSGGTRKSIEKGLEIAKNMLQNALKFKKSRGDLSDLILGTECGGSDSFSGLSANPALGVASDIVIQKGGSVILAETTELIGAEHILAARSINEDIKKQVISTITSFEQRVLDSKADIRGANPSPGNIEGGLSSIEEKSLGCIYKAGNQPVVSVKKYAQPITQKGLTLMDTPGNDIEQLSAMVAGGCNICVFTTGRGTPTGSPITPTIKVSSNSAVYHNMNDAIDINAGSIIDGQKSIKEVGEEILDFIVAISNAKLTKAEQNEQNDFSIWRLATTV